MKTRFRPTNLEPKLKLVRYKGRLYCVENNKRVLDQVLFL